MTDAPLSIVQLDGGACWRIAIGGSKGNILDARLMDALARAFRDASAAPAVKTIVLEGQGTHFSFGASVQEHLPDRVAGMLRQFHDLLATLIDTSVPVLAAVRGQCLGGGLELVTLCHRVFASRDARLGQPEIMLGVFAPVASVVLPERVGRRHAEDLLVSGRTVGAGEAFAMGLIDEVVDGDPAEAALAYARQYLLPKSASSLRYAVRAIRRSLRERLRAELPTIERLYLGELMKTSDAVEGLQAFVERRPPVWRNA